MKYQHTDPECINETFRQSYVDCCKRVEKYGYHISFNGREIYVPFSISEDMGEPCFSTETECADYLENEINEGNKEKLV